MQLCDAYAINTPHTPPTHTHTHHPTLVRTSFTLLLRTTQVFFRLHFSLHFFLICRRYFDAPTRSPLTTVRHRSGTYYISCSARCLLMPALTVPFSKRRRRRCCSAALLGSLTRQRKPENSFLQLLEAPHQ